MALLKYNQGNIRNTVKSKDWFYKTVYRLLSWKLYKQHIISRDFYLNNSDLTFEIYFETIVISKQAHFMAQIITLVYYRWSFNPNNDVAHAVWQAFHSREEVKILNGNVWAPKVVSGKGCL